MKKKILIVKPNVIDDDTRTELKKAGYIVIETENPQDIQVFDSFGSLDYDSYLECALVALSYGIDPTCRHEFGKRVRETLLSKLKKTDQ